MKSSSTETRLLFLLRILVFTGWCALTLWMIYHHELWRDEADSWLLARDGDPARIFAIMPHAGHPPLWYLILYPFAKASLHGLFDWHMMQAINWLAACGSIWLLVFRSGLTMSVVVPAVFSFVLSFEYPVIARNYSLGVLGLFLYASQCAGKKSRPSRWDLVANTLLCGSTVHFMILGAILFAMRICKEPPRSRLAVQRTLYSEWTFLLPFALSIAVLWPTSHGQFSSSPVKQVAWQNFFDSMTNMFLPFEVPALLPFLGSIALLALSMAGFRKLSGVWLFLSGLAAIEAIFVFAYYGKAPRHSGILLVWLVAAQWIASAPAGTDRRSEKKQDTPRLVRRANLYPLALTLMTAWNLPLQIDIYRIERDLDYSEAYLAAEVLNMAEYKDRQIVCWLPRNCLAVIAYLSDPMRKFWYPVQERAGTFELWDARSHAVNTYMESRVQPFSTILSDTRARFKNWGMAGGPLFISSKMVDEPGALGLQLLKAPPGKAWRILDESFWIYAPSGDSAGAQGATLP